MSNYVYVVWDLQEDEIVGVYKSRQIAEETRQRRSERDAMEAGVTKLTTGLIEAWYRIDKMLLREAPSNG